MKTTSLFGTDNEAEAHYLCAVINSTPVREFIRSYSSAGRGFGAPSVMNHIGIQKFDLKSELHQKLAQLSKTLHGFKVKGEEAKISQIEKENDKLVKQLFNIKMFSFLNFSDGTAQRIRQHIRYGKALALRDITPFGRKVV